MTQTQASYIVECFWPDVHQDQIDEAEARLKLGAAQMSRDGQRADYTGSILIPGDEVVFYLFEAVSSSAVQAICEHAGLRFARVVQSVHRRSAPK
jgi:hypothetical protein